MPNRVLRDWTKSKKVDQLSLGAEVFFTRLIMKADDYGRFHGEPSLLRSYLFPLKELKVAEVAKWVSECVTCDPPLIRIYEVDGHAYCEIINFGQRKRAMYSGYPDPETGVNVIPEKVSKPTRKPKETVVPESIPLLQEFMDYARSIPAFSAQYDQLVYAIETKYLTWKDNGWKTGHGKPIKNWKLTLQNTMPFLKPIGNGSLIATPSHANTGDRSDWDAEIQKQYGKDH